MRAAKRQKQAVILDPEQQIAARLKQRIAAGEYDGAAFDVGYLRMRRQARIADGQNDHTAFDEQWIVIAQALQLVEHEEKRRADVDLVLAILKKRGASRVDAQLYLARAEQSLQELRDLIAGMEE